MSDFYDIDLAQPAANATPSQQSLQLLSVDKRVMPNPRILQSLFAPLQWLRDLWLGTYRLGDTSSQWLTGTIYSVGGRVQYQKQVWECLVANTASSTNFPATGGTYWMLVQANFIGLSERLGYNGQCIVLTYALNKWFGTTFRQPTGTSDIYISNNTIPPGVFIAGGSEAASSQSFTGHSSAYIINSYSFSVETNFTINVPVAVYNALDTTGSNNDKIFRSFAGKYIPSGLVYSIATY